MSKSNWNEQNPDNHLIQRECGGLCPLPTTKPMTMMLKASTMKTDTNETHDVFDSSQHVETVTSTLWGPWDESSQTYINPTLPPSPNPAPSVHIETPAANVDRCKWTTSDTQTVGRGYSWDYYHSWDRKD